MMELFVKIVNNCVNCFHKKLHHNIWHGRKYRFYLRFHKQPSEVFCKKVFLEILQNSKENTCVRVSFWIKLRPWHRCFPVSFAKFLRTPFFQNTFGRLFLRFEEMNHRFFSNITILDFSNHKSFGQLSQVLNFNKFLLWINIFHYLLIQSAKVYPLTRTHKKIR